MIVKIARTGAEVTELSHSLKKQEDGKRMGADNFYATPDPETFKKLNGFFDLIINTLSIEIDWDQVLEFTGPRWDYGRCWSVFHNFLFLSETFSLVSSSEVILRYNDNFDSIVLAHFNATYLLIIPDYTRIHYNACVFIESIIF